MLPFSFLPSFLSFFLQFFLPCLLLCFLHSFVPFLPFSPFPIVFLLPFPSSYLHYSFLPCFLPPSFPFFHLLPFSSFIPFSIPSLNLLTLRHSSFLPILFNSYFLTFLPTLSPCSPLPSSCASSPPSYFPPSLHLTLHSPIFNLPPFPSLYSIHLLYPVKLTSL